MAGKGRCGNRKWRGNAARLQACNCEERFGIDTGSLVAFDKGARRSVQQCLANSKYAKKWSLKVVGELFINSGQAQQIFSALKVGKTIFKIKCLVFTFLNEMFWNLCFQRVILFWNWLLKFKQMDLKEAKFMKIEMQWKIFVYRMLYLKSIETFFVDKRYIFEQFISWNNVGLTFTSNFFFQFFGSVTSLCGYVYLAVVYLVAWVELALITDTSWA